MVRRRFSFEQLRVAVQQGGLAIILRLLPVISDARSSVVMTCYNSAGETIDTGIIAYANLRSYPKDRSL